MIPAWPAAAARTRRAAEAPGAEREYGRESERSAMSSERGVQASIAAPQLHGRH